VHTWGINLHLDTSDMNESEPERQFVGVISECTYNQGQHLYMYSSQCLKNCHYSV